MTYFYISLFCSLIYSVDFLYQYPSNKGFWNFVLAFVVLLILWPLRLIKHIYDTF